MSLPAAQLSPAEVQTYLRRLHLNGPLKADLDTLTLLHRAHLERIPFENLDIGRGQPIRLDGASVYAKVVGRGRGGYCYELNSLFAALLTALGYTVRLLSARVARPGGTFSAEFDHLALWVNSKFLAEPHLADVGFGDAFLEPLPLRDVFTRQEAFKTLKLERDGERWIYLEDRGEGFAPQYSFTLTPREIADFDTMNVYQQTSPDSHFTQNALCTRAAPQGRVTLSGGRLITTVGAEKTERLLSGEEVTAALEEHFGVRL